MTEIMESYCPHKITRSQKGTNRSADQQVHNRYIAWPDSNFSAAHFLASLKYEGDEVFHPWNDQKLDRHWRIRLGCLSGQRNEATTRNRTGGPAM